MVTSLGQDPQRPSRLYTGTLARGVFVSDDGGDSWRSTELRSGPFIRTLTVGTGGAQAPSGGGVYAAVATDVFHSADGETGWSSTGLMASSSVLAIGLDDRFVYAGTFEGVYRLDATGWSRIAEDQPFGDRQVRAFQHAADGTLYVGTGEGLFATGNGGDSFTAIAPDLFQDIFAIAADPGSDELLVFSLTPRGLYRSQGGGSGSWTLLTANLPLRNRLQSFSVQPHPSGRALYAVTNGSLLRSTDLGASWQLLEVSYSDRFAAGTIVADRTETGVLYAPGGLGLARSLDGGATWSLANRGRRALALDDYALAGEPFATTIYASNTQGYVYGTENNGVTWDLLAQPESEWEAPLAVHPQDPDTLFRGVTGNVLRSDDGGETWMPSTTPLTCNTVSSLALAPSNPDILYAQGYSLTSGCSFGMPEACFTHRSDDGGVSWSCIAEIEVIADRLTVDPREANRVYALTHPALLRTDDGGSSWSSLTDGLDTVFFDFVLDPQDPDVIYLAADAGLFRSPDRGATWVRWDLEPSPGSFEALAVHPEVTDNLYGLIGDRLLWSTDSGRTWRELPGIDQQLGLQGPLRPSPAQPSILFAGTAGAGVVRRTVPVETECAPDAQTLCLGGAEGDRFEVSVSWEDFQGRTGRGQGLYLPNGPGAFWFFNPDNLELAVKILDGRPVNGHWWVFFGALTNVEFTLTVKDTATGQVREYFNPLRNFASRGDTRAFPGSGLLPEEASSTASQTGLGKESIASGWLALPAGDGAVPEGGCTADGTDDAMALCLAERFLVRITWRDFQDRTGTGTAIPLTDDTGSFWFFSPENTEMLVKVLDGRPVNGHWWVFFGSLTNVEFSLTVEDLATGDQQTYVNPLRTFASRGDTRAFDG